MARDLEPRVGKWYKHLDKGQLFRVIDVDEDNDTIEVQHFDGDLEQFESSEWFEMDLARAAQPEDWTGPVDDIERDDLPDSETSTADRDWRQSLDEEDEQDESLEDEDEDKDQPDEWDDDEATEDY